MSRVRLEVVLAEPARSFVPGEVILGRVEVAVDEDCTCRALTVGALWRTFGTANATEGIRIPVDLGSGEWKSGDRLAFPFSLAVPEGPPTYEGTHFSVAWTVRAAASLSFAFDGKGEAPITVVPPPSFDGTLLSKEDSGCVEAGCALAALAVFVVAGLPILVSSRFPGVPWAIASAAGGMLAVVMAPFALAYRRVGKVTVEVGPAPAVRGGEIAVRAVLVPRRNLGTRPLRAELVCTERARKGSGKQAKWLLAQKARESAALEGPADLPAGREAVFAGMLPVAADGPPTLVAGDHRVTWKLKVSVEFPILPNPSWEFEVPVR